MSHEQRAKQLMDALPSGKTPRERHRTPGRNYVKDLAWSHPKIPPAKLPLVVAILGDSNSSCVSAIPEGQVDKEKYTKLIQRFP